MGDALKQLFWSVLCSVGRHAWFGLRWGWLRVLQLLFSSYWPGYLRRDLQVAVSARMHTIRQSISSYDGEHWATLKSRLPTALRHAPMASVTDIAVATEFLMSAWGRFYRVYVDDAEYSPLAVPPPGTAHLPDDQMETLLKSIYQVVEQARRDQLRRQQEAERQRQLDEKRRQCLAEEQNTAATLEARARQVFEDLLRRLEGARSSLQTVTTKIKDLDKEIQDTDDQIANLTREIERLAKGATPLLREVQEVEEEIIAKVIAVTAETEAGPAGGTTLASLQQRYANQADVLRQQNAEIDTQMAKRHTVFCRRTSIRTQMQQELAGAEEFSRPLQALLDQLRAGLNELKNPNRVEQRWQALKQKISAEKNDWPKMDGMLHSASLWHLTRYDQSTTKQKVHDEADRRGKLILAECNRELGFVQAWTPPEARPEEQL